MARKTDIKTCRYEKCCHADRHIDIASDDYTLVGKTMYYHKDCYQQKKRGEWKDEQTKSDLQYIKNQWVLQINRTVVYSQLFRVLNEFLARGIPSDYLVFVFDYIIANKLKLNYPNGLKYYIDRDEIKKAYWRKKGKKPDKAEMKEIFDRQAKEREKTEDEFPVVIRRPVKRPGFESILKREEEKR